MNIQNSNNVIVCNNKVIVNGVELPPAPCKGNNPTIVNGKVYLDGYEFKDGQWKHTLKALWYKLF